VMPAGEFIFGLGVIGDDPIAEPGAFVIKDGYVTPPSGPGLGITINEDALEAYTLLKEVVA
jgi:L-alanine-DL-glutamate epimerase-like enolase superfamily enzyme